MYAGNVSPTRMHYFLIVLKHNSEIASKLFLVALFFLLSTDAFSQAGSYYNSISTSSPSFVSDLESRIRSPYNRISYDNYDETNIANFASIDNGNGTRSVFCVYTSYEYIYTGIFTWAVLSREHTFAHSWMPTYPSTSNDQYSDQYHLFPTHNNNANGRRSNHPFGVVVNVSYQFMDGKLGTNSNGETVYEPRDIHKGDCARALFYMCVRYDGIAGNSWNFNWLNGTKLPALGEDPQDVNVLLNWNLQDPPDKWEVDRNNYIQSIQLNRNPFVDHPEYVSYIDFSNLSKLNPVYAAEPSNYPASFTSVSNGSGVQLNWNDATGSQLPSGYLIVAYGKNSYFLPVDGSVYSNDTVLSDGSAIVNVPYTAANTYTFSNLSQDTFFFSAFSYNGSGSQINYKIDGTFPQTNCIISGSLAAEPSNHVTNFAGTDVTSNSIKLTWNDASPGSQAPSGYVILANNTGTFADPSDGVAYPDDSNLADGSALINVAYNAANEYTFNNLFSGTIYYFRMYSYNGSGAQRNYKTNGIIPSAIDTTSQSLSATNVLLDNFNRSNNTSLGTTLFPQPLVWSETETASPTSISLSGSKVKLGSTTAGREFAYVNIGGTSGYPSQFKASNSNLTWAINLKQTRSDPSGFDASNYGIAFILGKTSSDVSTGNGYAVVLGQSGSMDAIRLAKFTNGINANSRFTNIISGGDYSNQYLSIKVIYEPAGNIWSLFVDSSSSGYVQSDPRNSATQIGSASDSSYTNSSLGFLGVMWNHATGASDSLMFDEIYTPSSGQTSLNLKAIVEGYFDTGANKLNINDTARIYLRNSIAPYAVIDSAKSVIDSLTYSGIFSFPNAATGNYYLEFEHRNSIETWSKLPVTITAGNVNSYDFTTAANAAFGDNLTLKNGKYCIYSGDVDRDGAVDISDIVLIFNDAAVFASGYFPTDINGDDFVDLTDVTITFNNSSNFVSRIVP